MQQSDKATARGAASSVRQVRIQVTPVSRGDGDYEFRFSGSEFVAPNGDLDFRPIPTPVEIVFVLSEAAERGFRFATPASNAIGIALESKAEPGRCPSPGEHKNDQFFGFRLSRDRKTLRVVDRNSDQQSYRYALNFNNAKGCAVVLDPKIQNDGSGGTGDQ